MGGHKEICRTGQPGGASARDLEALRPALARYFRVRVREDSEVDDLVQEVFTRIVARRSENVIEHVAGYVFHTAASVLADRARQWSRGSKGQVQFDPEKHGGTDLDPHQHLAGREELRATLQALLTLPDRTRAIFILNRIDGHRYREIGLQLGISVSAVEKHMVRAIQHLHSTVGARS